MGCAIQPAPFSSVRARIRSPGPSAGTAAALNDAQLRRRCIGMPTLGHRDRLVTFDVDDAQHRHLRDAAHLVEGAAGGAVDQPLVRHVLQQRLE